MTPSEATPESGTGEHPELRKGSAGITQTEGGSEPQAGESAKEIKEAGEVVERAREKGYRFLDAQKNRVASEIHTYSNAVRTVADRLESESDTDTNLARFASSAADRLDQLGQRLEERDLEQLTEDLNDLARRRPEVVYGGMFVVGLAAARFLKSSRRRLRKRPAREERKDSSPEESRVSPTDPFSERRPPDSPPGSPGPLSPGESIPSVPATAVQPKPPTGGIQ